MYLIRPPRDTIDLYLLEPPMYGMKCVHTSVAVYMLDSIQFSDFVTAHFT